MSINIRDFSWVVYCGALRLWDCLLLLLSQVYYSIHAREKNLNGLQILKNSTHTHTHTHKHISTNNRRSTHSDFKIYISDVSFNLFHLFQIRSGISRSILSPNLMYFNNVLLPSFTKLLLILTVIEISLLLIILTVIIIFLYY